MDKKRNIKLFFASFWKGFDPYHNFFIDILEQNFNIEITSKNPDILIHSIFGKEYLKYNCIRIGFTGENTRPDFKYSDYYIGFDYLEDPRYLRWPLYLISTPPKYLMEKKEAHELAKDKTKFAAFVVSNPNATERIEFFHKLSAYKKVSSGGRLLNNTGHNIGKIHDFLKEHKFTIAFENSSYPGYTTEKITQAMLVGSIPIYWGNPRIAEEFNPKSFINVHDYSTFDEVVEKLKEIDQDENKYMQMLNEPWFHKNQLPEGLTYQSLYNFFQKIISQQPPLNKITKFRIKTLYYYPYKLKSYMKKIIPHIKFRIRQIKRWYQKRFIIQEYMVKRTIILEYANKYNTKIFVETGTFMGDTIDALKNNFNRLYSIELAEKLALDAQERFKGEKHSEIIKGDSAKVLPGLTNKLDAPTLFWLDGHYSSTFFVGETFVETAKGEKETPIMEELNCILKNAMGNHVILIDDARCFNGTSDYPTKKQLYAHLKKLGVNKKQISISKDIIRITP